MRNRKSKARPINMSSVQDRGFRMEADDTGDFTDVVIYSEIGYWGVEAATFIRDLQMVTTPNINLRINSPGGDVFDGIAIYNALVAHPAKVTSYVDSLAASIATLIALAGDEVEMGKYSMWMIHDASGGVGGNAEDMRAMADLLDKISQNIAQAYADASGGDADDWRALMKAETWYTADEAVTAGLATRVNTENNRRVDNSAWIAGLKNKTLFTDLAIHPIPAPQIVIDFRPQPLVDVQAIAKQVPKPVEAKAPPVGRSGDDKPFVLSADGFATAMRYAAEPPVPENQAPFHFDPEVFQAMMADQSASAPAIAQKVQPEQPKPFDFGFLQGVIMDKTVQVGRNGRNA